jgi:hypothetical protein
MTLPRYRIAASPTPDAGKGLVFAEQLACGGQIPAADDLRKVYKWNVIVAALDDCAISPALRPQGQA